VRFGAVLRSDLGGIGLDLMLAFLCTRRSAGRLQR
jgi:hypothetical protein